MIKREGGLSGYDKGGGQAATHAFKFVAGLQAVTTSHEEQASPRRILVFSQI